MMTPRPIVSVVLGSYNRFSFLRATIASIRADLAALTYEVIVIDGGSTDGSLRWLEQQKDVITIIQHNRGQWQGKPIARRSWGYFMNLGFKCAQGKFICMLSDDCLVIPGAIQNGVTHFENLLAQQQRVGALAFYWRNWPEESNYRIGKTLGDKLFVNHGLYLRQALAEANWAEEECYAFYHADGDLCLKLWQLGYEVAACPDSYIEHFGHANTKIRQSNSKQQPQDWQSYLERWTGIYYSPKHKNEGGWLQKNYIDPAQTYLKFPFLNRYQTYFTLAIKKQFRQWKSFKWLINIIKRVHL